jgi:hypothetical protein
MREASFWNGFISKSMTIYANLIFILLWGGLVVALVVNREWLDEIWRWTQGLPSVPKILVWVLFLPIMVGLWIWESSWPTIGRLVGITGIVVWTLLAVYSLFKFFR